MLVLSRKPLETIVIGSDIRITIVNVDRNQVRLGIEAPEHISVLREELLLDAEEREAKAQWQPIRPAKAGKGPKAGSAA